MTENNPGNFASAFEVFLEEVEAETHGIWEITPAGRDRVQHGK